MAFMMPTFRTLTEQLQQHGIVLTLNRKKVKNINFRVYPNELRMSVPLLCSEAQLIRSLQSRLAWIIRTHDAVQKRRIQDNAQPSTQHNNAQPLTLWGVSQGIIVSENERLAYYRKQLKLVMPQLFAKWQPIVGAVAKETRIKKMHTRWGSCNTRAKRIWLSVYLPAYPIECTEYVIVHELCHLHHANHSPAFWQTVAHAMPDYRQWHDILKSPQKAID